jgi:gamma-glutamylcyclotransferase (GGCT)/AIG2-like uncharacterized protein YtfP
VVAKRQYVFGYGSLLERAEPGAGPALGELRSYRRTWNVAMDNSQTIPGYKHYLDAVTGERGRWFVTFLNVVPDPTATVSGVLFEIDDAALAHLDRRERNYERIEVSGGLSEPVDGNVWVYVGSEAAVRRFQLGRSKGRAVVSREYYERVREDFASLGSEALACFDELTDPVTCPILDLRRIDHPSADAERARGRVRPG